MIPLAVNAADCNGCGACAYSCPTGAISLEPDREGFLYPRIDPARCISCEKCLRLCPHRHPPRLGASPAAYVAAHADSIRQASSSGGLFTALSDYILKQGGAVFGAVLGEDFTVRHEMAQTPESRDRMRDSKYVQSDIRSCFPAIADCLSAGRPVLFTGTPCQTAAVYRVFSKQEHFDKLLLCDVICHGVPSPEVWRRYVRQLQRETRGTIDRLRFRDKRAGWACRCVTIDETVRGRPRTRFDDRYFRLYFSGLLSRPACHRCVFTTTERSSDITIGDAWDFADDELPVNREAGLSLVLCSTSKGQAALDAVFRSICHLPVALEACRQSQLHAPSPEGQERAAFWKDLASRPFRKVLQRYTYTGLAGFRRRVLRRLGSGRRKGGSL